MHYAPPQQWWPPAAHQQYGDYVLVEGYGWFPRWYPYWEAYWYGYWQQLYAFYGGDANPQYAEYARDYALRTIAPQWGWQ